MFMFILSKKQTNKLQLQLCLYQFAFLCFVSFGFMAADQILEKNNALGHTDGYFSLSSIHYRKSNMIDH